MKNFTISQAVAACGGTLNDPFCPDRELGSVVIDSRKIQPGDLFVAYRGEKVDGHEYIQAALDKGAACCLAERVPERETRPVILVPDVQRALEQIAASYRATLSLPVVGITGSVGKTSAKEMIAAVLGSRYSVLKTEGNLNNQIGVPMTVSRITPEHEVAVVEMGISGFGEMSLLARIARPQIGVFTVIGHAHLEQLHDLDGVFRAKTEMLKFLPPDGTVVVNGDDPYLNGLSCPQTVLRAGLGEGNDVRAENISTEAGDGLRCTIVYGERRIPVHIPAFGKHLLTAALLGAAVGLSLGLTDEEIAAGIQMAVAKRCFVMAKKAGATDSITLTGGCAKNDGLKAAIEHVLKLKVVELSVDPQLMGALGAAEFARQKGRAK